MNAGIGCPGRERVGVDPPLEHRRCFLEFHLARIELRVGVVQADQRVEDCGTAPAMPRRQGVIRLGPRFVTDDESVQTGQVIGTRGRRAKGRKGMCQLQHHLRGPKARRLPRPLAVTPRHDKTFEGRKVAEIAGFAEGPIEGRDFAGREPCLVRPESKV
jgi:hypothetical protein